jgi:cytochrome c
MPSMARFTIIVSVLLLMLGRGPVMAAEPRCQAASLAEAKAMAIQAAEILVNDGPEVAFRRFSDPEDDFIDRDLYVFVLDMTGRIWFNAVFPTPPGRNILGSRDSNGRFFVQDMIKVANTRGEGWVEYEWLSPCTSEMTPKSAYVVRVGPLLVAVGAYGVMSL